MKCKAVYFFLFFTATAVTKKTFASGSEDSTRYLEKMIREYFVSQKSAVRDTLKLNETLAKIDFSKMKLENFPSFGEYDFGRQEIILIPTNDINVHNFNRPHKEGNLSSTDFNEPVSSLTKAIFYLFDNKIIEGNLIEISSSNYITEDIDRNFTQIILLKRKDFIGHLNINYLSQRLCNDWQIENGKPVSSTTLTEEKSVISKEKNIYRYDWFRTTHFFNGSGTTKYSQYVYSETGNDKLLILH